jgi:hypothetical protein
MMTNDTDTKSDTIIDLDADQVIDHNEASPPKSDQPYAHAKIRNRNWIYGAAALAIAAVGGGWIYKDLLSGFFPSNQVLALSEKVATLEAGNATLRDQLAAVERLSTQLSSDVDSLEGKEVAQVGMFEQSQKRATDSAAQLGALEQKYAALEKTLADMAFRPVTETMTDVEAKSLQQRLTDLEKDVAALKTKPAEPINNTAALSQNLSDLKAKISAGTGFGDELDRIQRMVPAAAGLDVLSQHASAGLPDAKGLSTELRTLISDLPKPIVPGPVPESEGWWAGIYNSLSDLITIKVEGDVDWPTSASAAAAFAESGDLPQAIEHLKAVEAAKPAALQQWLDRAQARLAIETALQSVEEAVLRVIAAKG